MSAGCDVAVLECITSKFWAMKVAILFWSPVLNPSLSNLDERGSKSGAGMPVVKRRGSGVLSDLEARRVNEPSFKTWEIYA